MKKQMKSEMVKIASIQGDIRAKSIEPRFNYFFKEADVPIEVNKEHVEKILKNKTFYEFEKRSK